MRVVIAPDKFAGTLSAVQAADAIAEGWARTAPGDELLRVPMSDGGPGFVDVLHAVHGGELLSVTVAGPLGEQVPATLLRVGETAYLESAQAVGLVLAASDQPVRRDPEHASSRGLGELIGAAAESGATRIVVGLGGTGTNDGGAGLLGALGAVADVPLDAGPAGLSGITRLDVTAVRDRLAGIELVAASDVDIPLTGLLGATKNFGAQKGLVEDRLLTVDGWLEEYAVAAEGGRRLAATKGAGSAGGIGFALLLLGASRTPGVDLVAEAVGLADRLTGADLVITGEGAFDFSSRSGKVPYGVAALAAQALLPCIALAGRVLVGSREMRALGIESGHAVVDLVGEELALGDPAGSLSALAERIARSWSR